jgi:hypothetical protein
LPVPKSSRCDTVAPVASRQEFRKTPGRISCSSIETCSVCPSGARPPPFSTTKVAESVLSKV